MSKSINPMFFLRSGTKQVRLRPGFHRLDEFATGYSLAGCTPAEPASASPIVFHLRAEARYLSTVSWRRIAGLQGSAETEYQHQVGANLDERDGATPDERTQFSANGKHLGTIQVQRLLFELFAVSVSPNRLRAAVHSEDILNQEQIRS